jgi:hypothetical protein
MMKRKIISLRRGDFGRNLFNRRSDRTFKSSVIPLPSWTHSASFNRRRRSNWLRQVVQDTTQTMTISGMRTKIARIKLKRQRTSDSLTAI